MTIKELREALENIPDDCKVVLHLICDEDDPPDVYIDNPVLKMAVRDVSCWVKHAHQYDAKSENIVEIEMQVSDY